MKWIGLFVFITSPLSCQSMLSGEKKNPFEGQKAAIQAGQSRFREGCAACHGANAEGGRGPSLVKNRDLFRMPDQDVFNIIRRGIPGAGMPPSQMADDQTWQVVSYVRSLSSPAFRAFVDGDAAHGQELYFGSGHCDQCHAIRGRGGLLAADLSDAGAHLTVTEMRDSLEHAAFATESASRPVTIHLNDGSIIRGAAKDDSTYSIRVLGSDAKLYLIDKADVASIEWGGASASHSQVAQRLGSSGMQDVIAFLSQQVIRPNVDSEAPQRREIH